MGRWDSEPVEKSAAGGPWPSESCWWCGARATTAEHKIKARSLRRVAALDAGGGPGNVYKKSANYEGELRSLRKGSQVRWPVNLCAACNNARSQPLDRAHDHFEDFVVANVDVMHRWRRVLWPEVFGTEWQQSAADLARYFGKQLGCLLAAYRLPVPMDLIEFLDGAPECPSVQFRLAHNWRGSFTHKLMRDEGGPDGLESFVGLLPATRFVTDGRTSGMDYGYHLSYIWVLVSWREDQTFENWCRRPEVALPRVNGSFAERRAWRRFIHAQRRQARHGGA